MIEARSTTSNVSAEVMTEGVMVPSLDCNSTFIWCLNTAHNDPPVRIGVWLLPFPMSDALHG